LANLLKTKEGYMMNNIKLNLLGSLFLGIFVTSANAVDAEYKNIIDEEGLITTQAKKHTGIVKREFTNVTNSNGVTRPKVKIERQLSHHAQEWKNITDSNGNTRRVPIN